MFYNKSIEVWKRGKKYTNEIGQVLYEPATKILTDLVDIQPYSTEEAHKDYGFTVDCTKRMFCRLLPINIHQELIRYRFKDYEIVKIIEWDDYLEVFLDECKISK